MTIGFSMHQLLRLHTQPNAAPMACDPSKRPGSAAVSQSAGWQPPKYPPLRANRPRRHHSACRAGARNFGERLVIAKREHFGPKFTKVLNDVVGEAVVVVDQRISMSAPQSFFHRTRRAQQARALASVSSFQFPHGVCYHPGSGSDIQRTWSLMMLVRMVRATSMSTITQQFAAPPYRFRSLWFNQ
jgi:hypothetical protein